MQRQKLWSGDIKEISLSRFTEAQANGVYETALAEIQNGCKLGHWIWFIFPQLKGLGFSSMSQYYGISGLDEAKAYLSDEMLSNRLLEITLAFLANEKPAIDILGDVDTKKLCSCMTLFEIAGCNLSTPFRAVLQKFYNGKVCKKTQKIISGTIINTKRFAFMSTMAIMAKQEQLNTMENTEDLVFINLE